MGPNGEGGADAARPMEHALGLYFCSALEEWAGGPPAEGGPRGEDVSAYRLLMDAAVLADESGLDFVWLPERHRTPSGAGRPNPAVIAAALAVRTHTVRIRAGSVMPPLHDPLRVAEEWAVVDNLSNGRVEISTATDGNPRDSVTAPDAFAEHADRALRNLRIVQDLWSGREVTRTGPDDTEYEVRTYPRPVQPRLPYWITTAGDPDTFAYAGAAGAGLLTGYGAFPGERLAELVTVYRHAYATHHEGRGRVAVMAHTTIGDDGAEIRGLAERPLRACLADCASRQDEPDEAALRTSLDLAVQRHLHGRSLIGDRSEVMSRMREMHDAGADEIACLVDFGMPRETVLDTVVELGRIRKDRP
ncbi:MupA/Atu3671 family FMN-dependent luciferase-like monooxygenase [Sphaerisporangium rhizosphaerae]|uniref:MupA/Atu3671 family FMN-dependent luciferase-like monooxygenase n=1 Tax=Sphaerisporangium rhizosphaerae TaxID=2269375 RepID=A0ABW2PDV7_9ACTN